MSFQPQKKNRTAKQLHLCMQMLDQVHPQCWLTFKAVGITNSVINHALRCSATDPQGSTWPCSLLLSRTWHTKACCAEGTGPKHCSGTGYAVRSPVFYSKVNNVFMDFSGSQSNSKHRCSVVQKNPSPGHGIIQSVFSFRPCYCLTV